MASRDEENEILEDWSARLIERLGVEGLDVDLKSVLGLAGRAAHSVLRPAAPLTTYIVGYAAGLAAGQGTLSGSDASRQATDKALQLCREQPAPEQTD